MCDSNNITIDHSASVAQINAILLQTLHDEKLKQEQLKQELLNEEQQNPTTTLPPHAEKELKQQLIAESSNKIDQQQQMKMLQSLQRDNNIKLATYQKRSQQLETDLKHIKMLLNQAHERIEEKQLGQKESE